MNSSHLGTSHVVPAHSAAYSLQRAIQSSGRGDRVISFPDDLSCGPIDSDAVAARAISGGRKSKAMWMPIWTISGGASSRPQTAS